MKTNKDDLGVLFVCLFMVVFSAWAIYRSWALYFEPDYYREVTLTSTLAVNAFLGIGFAGGIFGLFCLWRDSK